MINFLKAKKLRKIKRIAFSLLNEIFNKVVIIVILVSLINMATPQIALAGTVDLPHGKVALPLNAGKKEILTRHPEDVLRLPVLIAEKAPRYSLLVAVTAYNSEAGQTDSTPCLTASGINVCERFAQSGVEDIVATNFMNLPFGAKVRFPELFGNKIFLVEDRMNVRYNGVFDIWMKDKGVAINFGLKPTIVEIF